MNYSIIPPYIWDKIRENDPDYFDKNSLETSTRHLHSIRNKRPTASGLIETVTEAVYSNDCADTTKACRKVWISWGTNQFYQLGRSEGGPKSPDKDVNRVYKNLKLAWEFYHDVFGINSYNSKGATLIASVKYFAPYHKDVIWDSSMSMILFGEPDNDYFGSFTKDLDVLVHEIAHGYIIRTSNLAYKNESGALHESYADVLGILAKNYQERKSFKDSNWLLGENILNHESAKALRSINEPGMAYKDHPTLKSDPQPNHYKDFVNTSRDYGGVHINSSIPSLAFYYLAEELEHSPPWQEAGQIWMHAHNNYLRPSSCFHHAKVCVEKAAIDLFKEGSPQHKAAIDAWDRVGIN